MYGGCAMKSYTKIKGQILKDKETRKGYQELGGEFALIESIIEKTENFLRD
jgi:hypothetical protein